MQGAWKGNQHQLLLVTLCSGFGTEKTLHIVKAFQDFLLVGALRVLFFPLLIQHSIFHVFKELGFIKTCLILLLAFT